MIDYGKRLRYLWSQTLIYLILSLFLFFILFFKKKKKLYFCFSNNFLYRGNEIGYYLFLWRFSEWYLQFLGTVRNVTSKGKTECFFGVWSCNIFTHWRIKFSFSVPERIRNLSKLSKLHDLKAYIDSPNRRC